MEEGVFANKFNELVKKIDSIPAPQREKLLILAKRTCDCHRQLKKCAGSLQGSLDYLRVIVKYLIFDLEATRRENSQLRKMLQDHKA